MPTTPSIPKHSRPLNLNETKRILIDLVYDLDTFCREHDLRYALAYGSLIGAIRHKGIIPWDDDIDVWMPRPDFMRLIQEYVPTRSDANYEIRSMELDRDFPLQFAKLCDARTISVDGFGNMSSVAVDIFILDGVGNTLQETNVFINKAKKMQRIWSNQLFTKELKISRQYSFKKNLFIIFGKTIDPFFSFDRFIRKILSFKQSHPFDKSKYCAYLGGNYTVFETKELLEYTDTQFEDKILRIPANFDHLLRELYGDYMQLPPEDKRALTHESTAYLISE